MKVVSVVVPCYNEEGNINLFYKSMSKAMENSKYKFELIFVNDGSKDNTLFELNKLISNKDSSIKIVNFSRNFGKESAMYAGLEHSTGDYAVIIDADMQQDPRLINKMLKTIEEYPDYDSVVFYQEKREENFIITILKSIFYKLINKLSEIDFVSGASDFRLINRKMINSIINMKEKNRFSKGIFSWTGFNVCYLPYKVEKRAYGKSKWPFLKLLKYAFSGIRSFSYFPLKLIDIVSNLLLILSFIYLIYMVLSDISLNIVIFLIIFIGGIIVKSIFIISGYIYDIYMEIKGRPIYITKEIITNGVEYER